MTNKVKAIIIGVAATATMGGAIASDQLVYLDVPGHKVITKTEYQKLKTEKVGKYLDEGEVIWNEYPTLIAVMDKEAKEGNIKEVKDVSGKNIVDKIIKKIK